MTIQKTLNKLRKVVPQADHKYPTISNWSVGMHIHHCCLAMIGICNALQASQGPMPARKWSFFRTVILTTGIIPRGRGKAPEKSLPVSKLSQEFLKDALNESEKIVEETKHLSKQSYFEHHIFGCLSRDESLRFLAIHNNHHLKIIRDIIKAS